MASLLLDFGADPAKSDSRGVTPLMLASSADDRSDLITALLDKSPSTLCQSCNEGSTALSFAARAGAVVVLRLLLEREWPGSEYNRRVAVSEAVVAACEVGQVEAIKVSNTRQFCSKLFELILGFIFCIKS